MAGLSGLAAAQAPAAEAPPARPEFEGAYGLTARYGPAYSGSSDYNLQPKLAGFVRWGRFTLSGAGGFVTKRQDETTSGASYELLRGDKLTANATLRYVSGRRDSETDQLSGMGDLSPTFRLRLGVQWALPHRLVLRGGISPDVGGKGLGTVADLSLGREWATGTRSRLGVNLGITAGDSRYMQAWHGVTPAQSASSGYAVYRPGAGLRDLTASASWRVELGEAGGGFIGGRWAAFVSTGAGRLLGEAANSPLTLNNRSWWVGTGLARRF